MTWIHSTYHFIPCLKNQNPQFIDSLFVFQIAIIATLLAAANAEAEAEADPAVLYANHYGGLGHYGYGYGLGGYRGYAGLGYAGHLGYAGYGLGAYGLNAGYYGVHGVAAGIKSAPCVNSLNVPVPCAGRKRRDADPEAEAEAEAAAYYYGGYYGRGYGYPYYGYGYGLGRYYGYGLHHTGVAAHPGTATSFVARSPQGLGK